MIETLAKPALDVVQGYLALPLGGKKIPAPYVMNYGHSVFLGVRVFLGKGSPREIVDEAALTARKHGINLVHLDAQELRSFLHHHHLGVDCSGLITHAWYALYGTKIFDSSRRPLWQQFLIRWRPFENLSVTRLKNLCIRVVLNDTRPGDMIVTRGERHALLVTETTREGERLVNIRYMHSTSYFRTNGVRQGEIIIIDTGKDLADQVWREGEGEQNWTHEGFLRERAKNGIFRMEM